MKTKMVNKMTKKYRLPKGASVKGFVNEMIDIIRSGPFAEPETLRTTFYAVIVPRMKPWAEQYQIDVGAYNSTHRGTFAVAVYKAFSQYLSERVLSGELTYQSLGIVEEERKKKHVDVPDHNFEIWFEKNGLFSTLKDFGSKICTSLQACKGFQSTNVLEQLQSRASQIDTVYILSDWDPSGKSLAEEVQGRVYALGMNINFKRIGINPEDIPAERRAIQLVELKWSDSRTPKFVEKYGEDCFEISALKNKELRQMLIDKLTTEDVPFEDSMMNRYSEAVGGMAFMFVGELMEDLKEKMERVAIEYIEEEWDFEPDLDEFLKSIVDKEPYYTYTQRFKREVKRHLLKRFNLDNVDTEEDETP